MRPQAPKKPRGMGKGHMQTTSVDAAKRLGPNLEKLGEAVQRFAVEGTVEGRQGQEHFALSLALAVFCGRVPASSLGGRV
jgi:hypothetical protein